MSSPASPIQVTVPTKANFNDTSLDQAIANTLFAVTAEATIRNASLKANYLGVTFPNWATSGPGGSVPNTEPPKPPASYVVAYFSDPTSAEMSHPVPQPYPSQTGPAVCDMPPIPGVITHSEGTGKIGKAIPGGKGVWFQALEGDTTPDGIVAPGTSQDGVVGLFQKVGFPMGAGWFQKIG